MDLRLGRSRFIEAISYAKVKTDTVDAATLAQLLRSDLVPEAHMVSAEWREARDTQRARLRLVAYAIFLEIDGIGRFPSARDFVSYCRLVVHGYGVGRSPRRPRTPGPPTARRA